MIKAKEKFKSLGWYMDCPNCGKDISIEGGDPLDIDEIMDCPHCKKKFKSIGWIV